MRTGFEPAVGESPGCDVAWKRHDPDLHGFALHDKGIFAVGVMLRVGTHVSKIETLVEPLGLHVAPTHIERKSMAGIGVLESKDHRAADALAAMSRSNGNVRDVVESHAGLVEQVADNRAILHSNQTTRVMTVGKAGKLLGAPGTSKALLFDLKQAVKVLLPVDVTQLNLRSVLLGFLHDYLVDKVKESRADLCASNVAPEGSKSLQVPPTQYEVLATVPAWTPCLCPDRDGAKPRARRRRPKGRAPTRP